jgi:hypothetical protein
MEITLGCFVIDLLIMTGRQRPQERPVCRLIEEMNPAQTVAPFGIF